MLCWEEGICGTECAEGGVVVLVGVVGVVGMGL